jgi:hypothetical protein
MRYRVRRIGLFSASKVGLVVGITVGSIPVLLNALGLAWIMRRLYVIVARLEFLGLVSETQATLIGNWGSPAGRWRYALLVVVGILIVGLIAAVLSALVAAIYNFSATWTAGLEVDAEELVTEQPQQEWQAAPPQPAYSPMPPAQQAPQPAAPQWPAEPSQTRPIPTAPAAPRQTRPIPAAPAAPNQVAQTAPPVPPAQAVPAAAPAGPRLVDQANPDQSYPLGATPFVLGSTPGSQVYDPALLPRHAEIHYDPNLKAFLLYDHSGGQVWVNDRAVSSVNKLNNGFRVQVGARQFIFNA